VVRHTGQKENVHVKVIQVGIGGMGNTWLKTVQASSEVEFSGFVEVNKAIAAQQAERYGLDPSIIFTSLDQALAAVPADGIIDVTPPRFHRDVSLAALEAGIPVLSEKPLSDTLAGAQDIVRKANETGVLHMVTQNYRYTVQAQTLKSVLASGELGQVGSVSVQFFKGPHFGGFREEMPYPLIIDMAIHHFDMMRFFLGCDPSSVYGRSWNPPWSWYRGDASAAVTLQFGGDVVVSYTGSWCSTGKETPWNADWRFECENGVLVLQDDQVYRQLRRDTLQDRGGYRQYENAELTLVKPVEPPYITQAYLLHEFYEAVTRGMQPATTCQDNIKSLAIVFNTVKSFETGTPIRFAE
jgi:predicted dehydrogenase